jgi:retinoblastoma-like protein 1
MSYQVMKLAAVRIRNLCDRLQQSQQVVEHVFRALQHALNHETILFFNRHIDQVILCCLYGICKVSRLLLVLVFSCVEFSLLLRINWFC